jgi:hypothetical protein
MRELGPARRYIRGAEQDKILFFLSYATDFLVRSRYPYPWLQFSLCFSEDYMYFT